MKERFTFFLANEIVSRIISKKGEKQTGKVKAIGVERWMRREDERKNLRCLGCAALVWRMCVSLGG